MRGRDKHGKKMRWSKEKKDKLFMEMFKAKEAQAKKTAVKETVVSRPRKQQKLLGETATKQQKKVVEETGDVLAECTFDESYDEDEEEHIAMQARKRRQQEEKGELQQRQVIVKGIPWDATDVEIAQRFAICGEIREIHMARTAAGVFRGHAKLTFEDSQSAIKAVGFDGKYFQARTMSVQSAVPQEKKPRKRAAAKEASDSEGESTSDEKPSGKGGKKGKVKKAGKSRKVKGGKGGGKRK